MTSAFSRIMRLMADLSFSQTVATRQTLADLTGIDQVKREIDWEGSSLTFSSRLLKTLHGRGRAELLAFLEKLSGLVTYIGAEQSERLRGLRDELAAIPGDKWLHLNERLPRVLITHDLKDRADEKLVERLRAGLEGEGYEVLCEPAEPGDAAHWRLKLIRKLGDCDGAVVIFGGDQDPELIYGEAVLLRWREWLEEQFKLVFVSLDGEAGRRAVEGTWGRLGLSEEEVVCAPAGSGMLEEVSRRLGPLKETPPSMSQTEKMERIVAQRFRAADEEFLAEALRVVGGRCLEDHSRLLIRTRLARETLSAGVGAFPHLVRTLSGTVSKGELKEVLELLAPSWVDLRSSGLILKVCRPGGSRRFCVNAELPDFTGQMYVRQAYYDVSGRDFHKRVIAVTARDGDHVKEYVLREIRDGITARFANLRRKGDAAGVSNQLINDELEARERDEGPTFVVLPPSVVEDYEFLNEIQARYPSLVLILFTGPDVQTPPHPSIEFLEPFLSPGDEDTAQTEYIRYGDLLE